MRITVVGAATIIVAAVVAVWVLRNLPRALDGAPQPQRLP